MKVISQAVCTLLAAFGMLAAVPSSAADRAGSEVYEAACSGCHGGGFGGFFTGAPETGDSSDWEVLLPKGIDVLTANTLSGIGDMEPRGRCEDCSDAEIRAAVEYMVERSR